VFDAPNFELRHLDPNVAIPFLNETRGSAIIGRALRMEACSPIVARHTAAAQDCEYEVAWCNTYQVGIDYTTTATRCGNTVINRHRAPASRHLRLLGAVPNVRAAAFRHSATEIGVEGLAVVATSTTSATTLAGLSFNGLDDITPTSRGLLLAAQRGLAFVVDCSQAKEFALVHSLVGGADGGRVFVRCFDAAMNVRENIAGDALASITTLLWNVPTKAWTGGAAMADASLNKRMTVRLGPGVAFAQIGIVGFDGQIELEALRLYGLPEAAPALLCGTPALPVGQREFAAEVAWDLPSLAPGAASLLDVTVNGARQGDIAHAALASSTRFIELDATAWSNNTVRALARNTSPAATFDLGTATLSVTTKNGAYRSRSTTSALTFPYEKGAGLFVQDAKRRRSMPRARTVSLEGDVLRLLRRAMVEERFDVADHLLRALETLAASSLPGSALAEAYIIVSEAVPSHQREHDDLSAQAVVPLSPASHVGSGARRTTTWRSRPR